MQVFFLKKHKLLALIFFIKADKNHKEFNMKILYLYKAKKNSSKNNVKHQPLLFILGFFDTTSCTLSR